MKPFAMKNELSFLCFESIFIYHMYPYYIHKSSIYVHFIILTFLLLNVKTLSIYIELSTCRNMYHMCLKISPYVLNVLFTHIVSVSYIYSSKC